MRIPQLIRIKHIVDLLNDCEYHKNQEILDHLDDKMDKYFSPSTVEKDIQLIKKHIISDYFESGRHGLRLAQPVDFWEQLKIWMS